MESQRKRLSRAGLKSSEHPSLEVMTEKEPRCAMMFASPSLYGYSLSLLSFASAGLLGIGILQSSFAWKTVETLADTGIAVPSTRKRSSVENGCIL